MKSILKKALAGALAAMMLLSAQAAVMAHSEMENMVFAGYDTTDWTNPNKIYNEVIDGKFTNKQVLVPVTPEWRIDGFELVYPYAGYSRMYLEGNKTEITAYNSLFPQWETRRQDYMWEMKMPYFIWERQQTKVNNETWTWDFGNEKFNIPDSVVLTPTVRTAVVVAEEFKNYGFGIYNNAGAALTAEEQDMYNKFNVGYALTKWESLLANEFTVASLSAQDAYGRYVLTDLDIAMLIPVVKSKYVTAKFNTYNDEGLTTKNIAAEYLAHPDYAWDYAYGDTFKFAIDDEELPTISWTAPDYELCEPYRQYQYLVVNGVVLDGNNFIGETPVLRYTGGLASPEITWKHAFFQETYEGSGIYEIVEQKYVDGVPGVDCYGNPVYRIPVGAYGKTYLVVNKANNTIEYRVTDHNGNGALLLEFPCDAGNVTEVDIINAYMSGSLHYRG